MATATLLHAHDPALVSAHLGWPALFITREADYLFELDCDQGALDAAIAAAIAGTPAPVVVPESVPAHHFYAALDDLGLMGYVQAYIDAADARTQMYFNKAPSFRRDAAGIEAGRVALGLTTGQVDALFVAAGQVVT